MAYDSTSDADAMLAARQRPDRVVFLDALRLLAALQMVQGHSLDAVMHSGYRTGAGFALWSFTRGLTSTAFLVAAGLSFAVVSAAGPSFERGRAHRLRRALMLVALGYLMHAPFGLLFGQPLDAALADVGIVDVLQCIGLGLLGLEGLSVTVSTRGVRVTLALCACAVLFAAAPFCDSIAPVGWARPLLHYLSARGGSVFPLVPWLGFLMAGFAVGLVVLPDGIRTSRNRQHRGLWLTAGSTLSIALVARFVFGSTDARLGFAFLALKLAIVLGVAAVLTWALFRVSRLPRLWTQLAGETLFLYVSHVVVLYAAGVGVAARVGPTQPLWASLLLALGLLVVCSACALAYRRLWNALRGR